MPIFLRAFVESHDLNEASAIQAHIAEKMSVYGTTTIEPPKRYWKIPTYIDVLIEICPEGSLKSAFEAVLPLLGNGWNIHRFDTGGDWAVWNASPSTTFVCEKVKWANLESIP